MTALVAFVAVLATVVVSAPAWNGHVPKGCDRPLPKGPGIVVVNATPVPVQDGQTILLCRGVPR